MAAVSRPETPRAAPALATPAAARPDSGAGTQAEFRNVHFHVAPGVVLGIRRLRGEMRSRIDGQPVAFDDPSSFVLHIASAEVSLDTASLGRLMNEHVFAYDGAPLRGLSFATRNGQLVQRGTLHKVVDIPFELTARVSLTSDDRIRVHPTAMRICSIPGKGLMDALGVRLSDLVDLGRAKGVQVDGNDLLLDPEELLPPPAMTGRLMGVRVEPGRLVQQFGAHPGLTRGDTSALAPPDTAAVNFMYFRGGTLRFGRLFMVRADMQIVDLSPADAFDFSIGRYAEQLVAGYSRTTPAMGLEVFMPDLSTVDRGEPVALPAALTGTAPPPH